jgi:hypothetical protein
MFVTLAECITWIVENTDITWAKKIPPSTPPEAKMCVKLFGLSELYLAGLLLDKRRGKMREEVAVRALH